MKIQKIVWVVILGIILRLLTAAFAYHTDTKEIYRASVDKTDIVMRYHKFSEVGNPLVYPPILYITLASYYNLAKPIFSSNFLDWMNDWSAKSTLNHPHIFRDMLAMKLPYGLAELAVILLLLSIVTSKNRNLLLGFWMLNPLVIWSVYVSGNFDIFPVLITVLALLAWNRNWKLFSYICIGLAAGFKLYPLLLIPALFVIDERPNIRKIADMVIGLVFFGLTFLPVIKDPSVIKSIMSTNLSSSLFKASVDIGVGAQLSIFLSLYFCFLIWIWYQKVQLRPSVVFSVILLCLLALVRFHQQWIIWVLPFLTLLAVDSVFDPYLLPLLGTAYFGSILLINDKFTNFGLLKGLNNAFDTIEPVRFWIDKFGVGSNLYGVFLALFLACSFYLSFKIIFESGKHLSFNDFYHRYLRPLGASLVIIPVLIFLVSHVLLVKYGKYIDIENKGSNASVALGKTVVIKQSMKVESSNFSAIEMSLKNVDLRSRDIINWNLESNGVQKAQGTINGAAVGDDFDTTIYFPVISDSKGETYVLTLTSPQATPGKEILIPYYATSESARLAINGKPIGNMSYTTYFNPGGYLNNLKYTLANMMSKW